jgi:ABC-type uncharacterized transport system substrate-binding protein
MRSQIVYAADGSLSEIRHSWTFDELFSTFATRGIPSRTPGVFTREELAPLAEVNVASLQEYDYFTFAKANGKRLELNHPTNYWLDFSDGILTLHFSLTLKKPAKVQSLSVEVYDPQAYVDFAFDEDQPVTLPGASPICKANVQKPKGIGRLQTLSLGEAFFNSLTQSSNWARQFAGRITVQCP